MHTLWLCIKIFYLWPVILAMKFLALCGRWTLYICTGGLWGIFRAAFRQK